MRKNGKFRVGAFRFPAVFVSAVLMMLLAACSSDVAGDVEELFATVPAGSGMVFTVNVDKAVSEAGGKISDGRIVSLGSFEDGMKVSDKLIKSGNVGDLEDVLQCVKPTAAVAFSYERKAFATMLLSDPEGFMEDMARNSKDNSEWEKSGSYSIRGGMAVVDNRLWICDDARRALDDIKKFMSLSKTESFMSNEYASVMARSDHALNMWGAMSAILGNGMSLSERTQANMAMNMIFSQPEYVEAYGDFDKKSVELTVRLLDRNLKPAKCELELSEIDPDVVASLQGEANMVFAVSVERKLVKQLLNFGKSMGGSLPVDLESLIGPLDGTIAFASPSDAMGGTAARDFRMTVTTDGKDNARLAQMLEELGKVDIKGNSFTVSNGRYGDGDMRLSDVAKEMKGAWLGVAMVPDKSEFDGRMIILLKPDGGSLQLRVTAKFD